MKRYIRSSTISPNNNAKQIAIEVFGKYYNEQERVKLYKQSAGYAVKYYAYTPAEAEDTLADMIDAADRLGIPVIKSFTKLGFLNGSIHCYVACIVVPAADVEASSDYGYGK